MTLKEYTEILNTFLLENPESRNSSNQKTFILLQEGNLL